jgi:hypothetical protein
LLHGRIGKHVFFAVGRERHVEAVAADDPLAIPKWLLTNAHDLVDPQLRDARELKLSYAEEIQRLILLDPFTRGVLRRIDDVTPMGTIIAEMQARLNVSNSEQLWERWRQLYKEIERFNLIGLAAA